MPIRTVEFLPAEEVIDTFTVTHKGLGTIVLEGFTHSLHSSPGPLKAAIVYYYLHLRRRN